MNTEAIEIVAYRLTDDDELMIAVKGADGSQLIGISDLFVAVKLSAILARLAIKGYFEMIIERLFPAWWWR